MWAVSRDYSERNDWSNPTDLPCFTSFVQSISLGNIGVSLANSSDFRLSSNRQSSLHFTSRDVIVSIDRERTVRNYSKSIRQRWDGGRKGKRRTAWYAVIFFSPGVAAGLSFISSALSHSPSHFTHFGADAFFVGAEINISSGVDFVSEARWGLAGFGFGFGDDDGFGDGLGFSLRVRHFDICSNDILAGILSVSNTLLCYVAREWRLTCLAC